LPDKINTCEPIASLVNDLVNHDCKIIEQKLNDYHFHEMYIKLQGSKKSLENMKINIENIEKIDENKYACSCHWSTVEIVSSYEY